MSERVDSLNNPIVFRDSGIEVAGVTLPGYLGDTVQVRSTLEESGSPMYLVSVTFMTQVPPTVDPNALCLTVSSSESGYEVRHGPWHAGDDTP